MKRCRYCGIDLDPRNRTDMCPHCQADECMLDDCERDGRREIAQYEAEARERRDYHQ